MNDSPQMPIEFELTEATLRSRRGNKWHLHPQDVIPAFVADMDFAVAAPIQAALARLVSERDLGYANREGDNTIAAAYVRYLRRRFGIETDAALIQPVGDLVQGTFAAVLAFSEPDDGVILHVPNYPPFREAITVTGRRLLPLTMHDTGKGHAFDPDEMRRLVDARTRIILLCNPQNPTGRVFSREELRAIADLAIERDLIVVSDEIHCDLVYPGREHIPFISLGPDVAARTITLNSATKSYNIPGLRCALMHFGNAELLARFHKRIPARLTGQPGVTGVDATIAAWDHARPWLDAVLPYLDKARHHVKEVLAAEIPEIRCHVPEATYLMWLDCRALSLQSPTAFEFFLEKAKIGFSAGETFEPAATQFVRMNFATSRKILDEILGRMIGAVRAR
jgi:cysteine-S-conjugate beta-lyase